MMIQLVLLACRGTPSVPTGPSMETGDTDPTCPAVDPDGVVLDCEDVAARWCDEQPVDEMSACCACDEAYCDPECVVDVPELPPDTGPELVFSGPLVGSDWTVGEPIWLGPDPAGLLRVSDDDILGTRPLDCVRTLNTFVCASHNVDRRRSIVFDVRLTDGDADGVADGGILRSHVRFMDTLDDQVGLFPLALDTEGRPADTPFEPLVPTDPIVVRGREPLDATALEAAFTDVGLGPVDVLGTGAGWALEARGYGIAPWGGTVALDGLTDVAGNPVSLPALQVVAPPGLANDNLDFELDGVGWVSATDPLPISDPTSASGGSLARIGYDGSIVGELAVPSDTPALSFQWRRNTETTTNPAAIRLVVVTASERTTVWRGESSDAPGTDGVWTTQTADLSPWAGQTVFVRFEVESLVPYPPEQFDHYLLSVPYPPPLPTAVDVDALGWSAP